MGEINLDAILAKARADLASDPDMPSARPCITIALVERLRAAESARDAAWAASYELKRFSDARLATLNRIADRLRVVHEDDKILAAFERQRQERYDALSVRSTDGLLSSEWLLRTGQAECERDEARQSYDDAQAMLEEVAAERDSAHADAQESREDVERHYLARLRADDQIAARDRALDACVERIAGLIAELDVTRATLARFAAGHLAPEYLDGALTETAEEAFLQHLIDCSKCEDAMAAEKDMSLTRDKGGE